MVPCTRGSGIAPCRLWSQSGKSRWCWMSRIGGRAHPWPRATCPQSAPRLSRQRAHGWHTAVARCRRRVVCPWRHRSSNPSSRAGMPAAASAARTSSSIWPMAGQPLYVGVITTSVTPSPPCRTSRRMPISRRVITGISGSVNGSNAAQTSACVDECEAAGVFIAAGPPAYQVAPGWARARLCISARMNPRCSECTPCLPWVI